MYLLNFPQFDYKLKTEANKKFIFDFVRKKYVALTPEEWVRQHVLHYLVSTLLVPVGLIGVEKGLTVFGRARRTDVVVFNHQGTPTLLIECKAPGISVGQSTLLQAALYNNTYNMLWLMVTNGHEHRYLSYNTEKNHFEHREELPLYPFTSS